MPEEEKEQLLNTLENTALATMMKQLKKDELMSMKGWKGVYFDVETDVEKKGYFDRITRFGRRLKRDPKQHTRSYFSMTEKGVQLWGEFVEDTLDCWVDLWRHGRDDLENVEAGETNHEFTFTAESRDGTRWESMPVDCHKFRAGDVVGRFVDGSGMVVVVTKRGKDGN